jgi:hypothetical protein
MNCFLLYFHFAKRQVNADTMVDLEMIPGCQRFGIPVQTHLTYTFKNFITRMPVVPQPTIQTPYVYISYFIQIVPNFRPIPPVLAFTLHS